MILATHYTVKCIKKGHKKYKEKQAEKERRGIEKRSQFPTAEDASLELDTTCLAESEPRTSALQSLRNCGSSTSTKGTERALEDDPAFQEFMARQKSMYLERQKAGELPPSYNSLVQEPLVSPSFENISHLAVSHCRCHECVPRGQTQRPVQPMAPGTAQLLSTAGSSATRSTRFPNPLPATAPAIELPDTQSAAHETNIVELDSSPLMFELQGNPPAVLPPQKRELPAELPI